MIRGYIDRSTSELARFRKLHAAARARIEEREIAHRSREQREISTRSRAGRRP
jgi:hypothetical protein